MPRTPQSWHVQLSLWNTASLHNLNSFDWRTSLLIGVAPFFQYGFLAPLFASLMRFKTSGDLGQLLAIPRAISARCSGLIGLRAKRLRWAMLNLRRCSADNGPPFLPLSIALSRARVSFVWCLPRMALPHFCAHSPSITRPLSAADSLALVSSFIVVAG